MYTLLSSVGPAGMVCKAGGREGGAVTTTAESTTATGLAWFKAVPSNEIDKK